MLDPKNTRIPADRRSDDQRALLHFLLEHEDIRPLATSIVKLGLFPNERFVVMPEGRRYVVLEGNRRLAAIRLILNPELAPTDAGVKFFRNLSSRADVAALGKLDVAVVESRIAAAPIIAALHTRESKRRWSSLQQARFYRELVDEGQTPTEIAEELGIALGQVSSYLRTEKLYRVALTLDYPGAVRRELEDARFPLTTLERFLESRIGRKFLGIELDEEQGFRGVVHPDRFKAVLARVSTDVATRSGLTRIINNEEGFQKYISETEKELPPTKTRGSFVPDALLGGGAGLASGGGEPAKQPPKRTPKPSSSIIPRGFSCRSKHERVRAIFTELKSINIGAQRNSSGVMLRVLLDIALWSYITSNGYEDAVLDHFDADKKKRKHNPEWTPPLRDLISYAVEHRIFPGMNAHAYKAVRSLASKDTSYLITIDGFNMFTHNLYLTPTEGDLRALWQRAEPMLEHILN